MTEEKEQDLQSWSNCGTLGPRPNYPCKFDKTELHSLYNIPRNMVSIADLMPPPG